MLVVSVSGVVAQDSAAVDTPAIAATMVVDSATATSLDSVEVNGVTVPATSVVTADTPTEELPVDEGIWKKVPGTPFSMFSLIMVGLVLAAALLFGLLLIFEQSLNRQAAALEGNPDKIKLQRRLSGLASDLNGLRKLVTYGSIIFMIGFTVHHLAKGSSWEGHLNEWMNLIVRWTHVTFGVVWIGASFYFIFLENALYRGPGIRDGLAGNLWAIHGGGFYYVEKYKVAPEEIPKSLHWFKWEAYITWISGVSLMFVVYYFNASSLLIDKQVADISSGAAIGIGIGSLVASWLVYDILCKSPIVENKPLFFFTMLGYITILAFFLTEYLSPRAAYIHVGAAIGTMMAGNVWRVIIPSQKAMVQAAKDGKEVDPELGRHAGLRSLHNNYFTLPILFIMISNHFPSTYGNGFNWAVLAALTLISAGVKHYFNLKDKGEKSPFMIPAATIGFIIVFYFTAPRAQEAQSDTADKGKVEFYQVYQTMVRRCTPCHSAAPIDDVNVVAPNGIMFDTPEQIKAQADRIMVRAVVTKTMPQGNKTNMTDAERELISRWVSQGASIE